MLYGVDEEDCEFFEGVVKRILFWIMKNEEFIAHWCFLENNDKLTDYKKQETACFKTIRKYCYGERDTLCVKAVDKIKRFLPDLFIRYMSKCLITVLTQHYECSRTNSFRYALLDFPIK